mmetsp:Transcript_14252/g.33116  ORF Transcript_14252/g.33116 Transcript_14252/m.33116 type:complete len:824 (-) Transcript_14252:1509-3980(-)
MVKASSEGHWMSQWLPFSLGTIQSILENRGILMRSLKEDYPLWVASMWLLWKQQTQNRKSIASPLIQTKTSVAHVGSSAMVNLLVDWVVLGTLLIYKKSRDEKAPSSDDEEEDAKTETRAELDDEKSTPKNEAETDPIKELRMLLKQHSMGSSTQLVTPKTRMKTLSLPSYPVENPTSLQLPVHNQPAVRSTITNGTTSYENKGDQQRYIELLVHNVAHKDLVMSLDAPRLSSSTEKDGNDPYCLCRPKFSAFDAYSQRLFDFLKGHRKKELREAVIQLPQYERNDETQKPQPSSKKLGGGVPAGFRLGEENEYNDHNDKAHHPLRVSSSELDELRIRSRDAPRIQAHSSSTSGGFLNINAVFFPLLATLMPVWEKRINDKYGAFPTTTASSLKPKKVLIIVSGVGQPRNWTHPTNANSTQQCAKLMKIFLNAIFPDLTVLHIHSDTNIFRYDENIAFVKQELLPRVQEYRDAHAKGLPYPDEIAHLPPEIRNSIDTDRPFSTEWRKSFSITISYADGSSARNSAIQASLRTFKPTFCHFWQLKTFWHEAKIVSSDVEIHSFEGMETLPPQQSNQFKDRPIVKKVVDEMKRFRDEFSQILNNAPEDSNDIRAFWLRKTHKPVLSVLAVQRANGKVKLYRGTNMEVSMPTGSLCAERNVIGTALADNPSLRREDLKMIAVLAVPNPKKPRNSNSIPNSRKSSIGQEDDWVIQDHSYFLPTAPLLEEQKTLSSSKSYPNLFLESSQHIESPSPARKTYLYNTPSSPSRRHKRAVVVHSGHDMNPLRPCGACNEWLKKLAESNPYFSVLTFTDADCTGVYCSPCEE